MHGIITECQLARLQGWTVVAWIQGKSKNTKTSQQAVTSQDTTEWSSHRQRAKNNIEPGPGA